MNGNQMNGNNMMEMIKTQLMTFTMMKSMNGNDDNSGQDNGMLNMIYIFLATAVIDFISNQYCLVQCVNLINFTTLK